MNLVKESLAKLLAQEDLIVEHRQVDTAQFNVETRVLTLPMWHHNSNLVVDMLIAHEVGHALYTPNRWDFVKDVPLSFVNVTEDIRIEKLMKRRYEGLPKTFFGGYNVLASEDFFKVEDVNWHNLNIADKLNIHYKIGSFVDVPFNADEVVFREDALNIETFDDAIDLAKRMHAFAKEQIEQRKQQQEEEKTETIEVPFEGRPDLGEDTTEYPLEDLSTGKTPQEPSEEGEGEEAETFEQETVGGKEAGRGNGPSDIDYSADDVHTADTLDDAIKDLAQRLPGDREFVYVEVPKSLKKEIFISNEEVSNHVSNFYNSKILVHQQGEFADEYDMRMSNYYMEEIRESDKEYNTYKKQSQKEVSYLVKEFECKKAADSYARSTTSRTGVLDCTKLHTYKYNEDLFKKVTTLSDGKNHGLVFILDWSGSMNTVLKDTIKQLYNLIWFCRKVNIPFDVYAFTQEYPLVSWDEDRKEILRKTAYTPKNNMAQVPDWFSLMNFFTSKVNAKTLEEQMKNIWRLSYAVTRSDYSFNIHYGAPLGLSLSGTPLNETIVALHQILPKFKKDNNVQKVQCVILTDGEAPPLRYHKEVQRHWEDSPYLGTSYFGQNSFLRDRKLGKTYSFSDMGSYSDFNNVLLNNLRDNLTDMNFIGIRVLQNRDASGFIRNYTGYTDDYEKTMKVWRKEKSFTIKNSGYHSYFGLSSTVLNNDTEFNPKEDATKAEIKKAFTKSLRGKKMNKKILGEFIDLVA